MDIPRSKEARQKSKFIINSNIYNFKTNYEKMMLVKYCNRVYLFIDCRLTPLGFSQLKRRPTKNTKAPMYYVGAELGYFSRGVRLTLLVLVLPIFHSTSPIHHIIKS